ncbi:MAG: mechanosensitive ion channel family protein [Clostridiaceae bacterium]|jgi:MscS family membrane protein|nr:mechanosensitive ion channel family protein [Clostridiaceae bacterium]
MLFFNSVLFIFTGQAAWLNEFFVLLVIGLVLLLFRNQISRGIWHLVLARFRKRNHEYYLSMRDSLVRPLGLLLPALVFNTALHQVKVIPDPYFTFLLKLADTATAMIAFWLLISVVTAFGLIMIKENQDKEAKTSPGAISLLASTIRVGVVIVAVFVILSFWVKNLSGIIAGVGIGGLAIALAAQDSLSNAFSSLMILFDQPFEVGDWIETSEVSGSVLSIGLRSTRIRPLDQSIVTIPNNKLASAVIFNGSLREKRRVDLTMVLPWTLTSESMEAFRQDLIKLLAQHDKIEPGSSMVYFSELPLTGAKLTLYYYAPPGHDEMIKVRNDINMSILKLAEKHEISFQTDFLYRLGQDASDKPGL